MPNTVITPSEKAHLLPEAVASLLATERSKLLIGGAWVEPSSGEYADAIDPATGEVVYRIALGTEADVDRAVDAAEKALVGPWRDLAPAARGLLISRLADALERHRDEIAVLEVLDTGKPLSSAQGDIDFSLATLRYFAGAPSRLRGATAATDPAHHSYTRREPVGVCALITAWNFPLNLAVWKIAPALAAGVTFVMKPSEFTSLTTIRLAQLAQEVGIPAGVFNLVTGTGPAVGAALVAHPGVAKVSFTGSAAVGRRIGAAAAETSKRVTLELGGKNPNIVFEDADLDKAIVGASIGAFANAGQVCCSGNRVFVQRSVMERFLAGLKVEAENYVVGDGLQSASTLGPMVSEAHFDKVCRYLEVGRNAGHRVIAGGAALDRPGYFVAPTVFADVDNSAVLAREEVFGPVVTVTPFDTEEEAIALANDTEYGLAAGLWTSDVSRAHRVAARLQAGTVWINTYLDLDPALPFGGYKGSGVGRDLGDASVEAFTELKSVVVQL